MGGTGLPGEILGRLGIDVLLCSGLGRRALSLLDGHGIEVCTGVSGTAKEAIEAWKGGSLSPATENDACQQHMFHDHH
jgi:predicted Fe-Mo cluster-binding NifX family protein